MSLFPAYTPSEANDANKKEVSLPWLQNTSCPPEISVVGSSLSHSSNSQLLVTAVDCSTSANNEPQRKFDDKSKTSPERYKKLDTSPKCEKSRSNTLSSHRKKLKKNYKHADSSKLKKKKKGKSHKKHSKDWDRYSSESEPNGEVDDHLEIPTRNGENRNIFLETHFHSLFPNDLGKILYYDRAPDKNNSIFANTHYTQLANYSRLCLHPLGKAPSSFTSKWKKKDKRYFSKSCRLPSEPLSIVRLTNEYLNMSYIPLQLTYKEEKEVKHKSESLCAMKSLGILDPSTENYLLDCNKSSIQEPDLMQPINLEKNYWQNRIKDYNERLAKEPHNVELWLEFVDIQDKAITHILQNSECKSDGNRKSYKLLVERKISLLEAAIAKNVRCLDLHLKKLQLGENIWDNKKLLLEWDKLVTNFPNDLGMWYQYLIFHHTYFSAFQNDQVVQALAKCSQHLRKMHRGTFLSHKPPENIGFALIDLAFQLAFIWYQGGYMERSIALFQALIEINLFCPRQLQQEGISEESKLSLFEVFWDSKAPRFGEKDSIGWGKVIENRQPTVFPEEILEGTHDEEDEILIEGGSKHHLWIRLESSRELNHWLPWQKDPENCEDVERMVPFAILKKHLFFTTSETETMYLIIQFLKFLGVPVPDHILNDNFPPSKASVFLPLQLESLKMMPSISHASHQDLFHFPVIGPSILESNCEAYISFITEVITHSLSVIPISAKPKLGCIFIRLLSERAIILRNTVQDYNTAILKSYKKMIKNLLKQSEFRSDLTIYHEYGLFESSLQSYEEAIKIYSTALTLGLKGNGDSLFYPNGEALWKHLFSLIKLRLEKEVTLTLNNVNQILNLICSINLEGKVESTQAPPNGLQLIKVKKKLSAIVKAEFKCLALNHPVKIKLLNAATKLISLCQLLTVGANAAHVIFEDFIDKIIKLEKSLGQELEINCICRRLKESAYQDYFWLLEISPRIINIFPFLPLSLSSMKNIINSALEINPNNNIFLQKSAQYQSWRDTICNPSFTKLQNETILAILFRLMPHITKVTAMLNSAEFGVVGAGYQLENMLEAAVNSPAGSICPLLWRLYLRLIQILHPTKLKQTAYRALSNCPHAKCLYLDFIKLVPDSLSDIVLLMAEKGIRIRLPLEELEVLLEEEKEDVDEDETQQSNVKDQHSDTHYNEDDNDEKSNLKNQRLSKQKAICSELSPILPI